MTSLSFAARRPPTVEIVVFGGDALRDIRATLKSIAAPGPDVTVSRTILAPSNAEADLRAELEKLTAPDIVLLPLAEAGSDAAAIAGALKEATEADFVVLLAAGYLLPPDGVRRLLEPMLAFPDVGLAGPLSNYARWQSVPKPRAPNGEWRFNKLPDADLPATAAMLGRIWDEDPVWPRVPALSGTCLAIRKDVLRAIEPPDTALDWLGGGDIDYSFRASDAGFGLVLATATFAYREKQPESAKDGGNSAAMLAERYGEDRTGRAEASLRDNPFVKRVRTRLSELGKAVEKPEKEPKAAGKATKDGPEESTEKGMEASPGLEPGSPDVQSGT